MHHHHRVKRRGEEDAFHNQRLCIEDNPESLKFVQVFDGPASTCSNPNGCIMYAHQGGLLVICHAIVQVYNRSCDRDEDSNGIRFNELK